MVSHKLRCIFIHIPKCAGTSVESAFGELDEDVGLGGRDHRTVRMLAPVSVLPVLGNVRNQQQLIRRIQYNLRQDATVRRRLSVTPRQFAEYFKFTIVRNPWTRTYSAYRNVQRSPRHFKIRTDPDPLVFLRANVGRRMLRPQLDWITDWHGRIAVDFIARFENLQQDFRTIASELGCPELELPRENVSTGPAASPFADPEYDRLIEHHYREEIELFGYRRPEADRRLPLGLLRAAKPAPPLGTPRT